MNLLEETLEILTAYKKEPQDVDFVLHDKGWCTFSEFLNIANFKYDNGYGGNEIYSGLKIVGGGWGLERGEYDGSEWWEFKTQPGKFNQKHIVPEVQDVLES